MPNHLAGETSPYLLQHADNPVAWYPWGTEALARARREQKPILLSIGYSACHWCHVMAHESFEDPVTAAVMNDRFINIKVDREERPDLDRIYQTAHQLLTRRPGGWPLTMILTPEQTPVFGGTYFPREPRHGLPAFGDILQRVADFLRENPDQIAEQSRALRETLERIEEGPRPAGSIDGAPLERAVAALADAFDAQHGGFGGAPKFPQTGNLNLLLTRDEPLGREMALTTLRRMALGGIHDQLGGGFYRYSVDERWTIPHFEKMLYDNGPLLGLMARAWQLSGEPLFRETAERTADWAMAEMQSPEGGFYAAVDADSEGEEGRFYLWEPASMHQVLNEEEYRIAAAAFGLDGPANFEGRWHLQRRPDEHLAEQLRLPPTHLNAQLSAIRRKLLTARAGRPHPGRDEKILTAWNGLMITGLAVAARAFDRPDYLASAERALDFLRDHLFHDGRLRAVYKDGEARLPAWLDDYAFTIEAVLTLLEVRWRDGDLQFARQLADLLLDHFEDQAAGGFFFTADDHETLIHRPKPFADESMPSGNGVAALALQRLGHLLGDLHYLDAAERTLRVARQGMLDHPVAHGALMGALDEWLQPAIQVILRGPDAAVRTWAGRYGGPFAPKRTVIPVPNGAANLPGLLASHPESAAVTAWVCHAGHCSPPIGDEPALANALSAAPPSPRDGPP